MSIMNNLSLNEIQSIFRLSIVVIVLEVFLFRTVTFLCSLSLLDDLSHSLVAPVNHLVSGTENKYIITHFRNVS